MPSARRMSPIPLRHIKITDSFWAGRQRTIADQALPSQFYQLELSGRLENFRRVARREPGNHHGFPFDDTDVYKWLEASAYVRVHHPHPKLKEQGEALIKLIADAQREDGYLDTFIQLNHPSMALRNLGALHEMYCAGHLIEAGVALFECLGDRRVLIAGTRFAHLLMSHFGAGRKKGYCGHPEFELALIHLSRATGDKKYREFARWMIEQRGGRPSPLEEELQDAEAQKLSPNHRAMVEAKRGEYSGEYCQDHAPIRLQKDVVGHAVRAAYLYAAAADLLEDGKDEELATTLKTSWANLTRKRMYITGGIGPSRHNEGFTRDYDLPNLTAYAETCAACGLVFWSQSMLEMTGSAEYADVIERALYNGALAGISLDGKSYFYDNPLESQGGHERKVWFDCACCPPNIARVIGNLGRYVLGIGPESVFVNLFVGCEAEFELHGTKVRLAIDSGLPWKGDVKISLEPDRPLSFALYVRIPDWADDVSTDFPGDEEAEYLNGYAVIEREWLKGDVLTLGLDMDAGWMEANPKVTENLGRTALLRGPLVYCAEQADNGFAPQSFSVDVEAELEEEWTEDLNGLMRVTAQGYRILDDDSDELYSPLGTAAEEEASLKLIPYYAWANRGSGAMQVWLRA